MSKNEETLIYMKVYIFYKKIKQKEKKNKGKTSEEIWTQDMKSQVIKQIHKRKQIYKRYSKSQVIMEMQILKC